MLDRKFELPQTQAVLSDAEIEALVADFVRAARLAQQAGFDFVDIKHCHGYLGHEFLSAVDRPGPFGGSLENRTRFLREIVAGIRSQAPGLQVAVRFSAVDWFPFRPRQIDRVDEFFECSCHDSEIGGHSPCIPPIAKNLNLVLTCTCVVKRPHMVIHIIKFAHCQQE